MSRSRAPNSLSPYYPLPTRLFAVAYCVELPAHTKTDLRILADRFYILIGISLVMAMVSGVTAHSTALM